MIALGKVKEIFVKRTLKKLTSTSVKNKFAEYFRFAFVYCDFIFKQKKKRMLEVLSCFVTITYLDFQEFFLFLHELSFILRHMVTQAHSQKSGGMRTAHVMLNLTKYRIK